MLSKLMKYELKATSRLLIPMYLVMLLMSIINRFSLNLFEHQGFVVLISALLMITFVSSIVAVLVVTVFYMIARFYKNLLTDEGYLMFTLPAKAHQLITSKLLVTMFWTIISIFAVLLSLFIAFANAQTLPQIMNVIREAMAELSRELGGSSVLMFVEFILLILLGLVSNILIIYVSIAIGQLFTKHKIVGSFVSYMGIYTAIQIIVTLILIPFGVFASNNQMKPTAIPNVVFPAAIVLLVAGSAACFLVTNNIFKRKLNLD
jgi:hypothetical protein